MPILAGLPVMTWHSRRSFRPAAPEKPFGLKSTPNNLRILLLCAAKESAPGSQLPVLDFVRSFSISLRISAGSKSSIGVLSTRASLNSSESVTHRSRASICERIARLKSRPCNWQRAARSSWLKASLFRNFRICGPTTLAGVLVRAMLDCEQRPYWEMRLALLGIPSTLKARRPPGQRSSMRGTGAVGSGVQGSRDQNGAKQQRQEWPAANRN